LRRRGFDTAEISELRRAFKILYRQGLTVDAALERLQSMVEETPSVQTLIDSLKQSQRGIVR
jgi:UDP-N-acetylglucosamine acyltransferase